jgi:hypothetical protein
MVSVTQSADDRDPKLIVIDSGRADPTAALPKLVAAHVGCVETGPDLLAAAADGTLCRAATVAAG